MSMSDNTKHIIDGGSITATTLAVMNIIPAITAILSLVWICIRIYETRTFRKIFKIKD